jgi:hypothetical protein
MKSIILLLSMIVLFMSLAFGQSYDPQYVHSRSGDTLVVKDDVEYGGSNTLYLLMQSDSLAPANRVYELKNGAIYSLASNPQSSKYHRTIIRGQTETSLKTSTGAAPPIITGAIGTAIAVYGGMIINKDLLVKNVDLEMGNLAGNNAGWAWFGFSGPNMRLEVENCIMEHTWWTWVGGPPSNTSVFFNNCYFVNLNGHSCRRNGGVVDFNGTNAKHQDTLSVQNCTHVNTQGILYRFREGYEVDRVIFNHNDFIDCAGYVIMNYGDQTNLSITNNVYVNCQLQAYCRDPIGIEDVGPNADSLAMGLVNVLVDSTFTANVGTHGIYVDKNLVYWAPSLDNIVSTLNASAVNGRTDWVSQMIDMNSRTVALFADKTHYPRLTNGTWVKGILPSFANTDVLFTTRLAVIKAYAIAAVDTGYTTPMPSWRQASNPEASNFVHADWPIPIDLSYTDTDLLTAGLGGFPVGDLGWFPNQYALWKAQESTELVYIQAAVDTGIIAAIRSMERLPQTFRLEQNYPNPFNPKTVISYELPVMSRVTLKVFDLLGREVATLVDGVSPAGSYSRQWNAAHMASGVYLYELRTGSSVITKKMILIK